MLGTGTRSVMLVTAFSVAALAMQIETADAAKKGGQPSRRDAVMEQCIAKAQAEAPVIVLGESGYRRAAIYKSCMVQAGMRP
jgi:hypothetical protein